MVKRLFFVLIITSLFVSTTLYAEQGEAVFEAQGCGLCHKPDIGKANPSLKDIARTYQGKEGQLIKYLKGEAEPIVQQGKGSIMKRSIEKTKALSEEERRSLADFIMSQGK